MKLFHGMGTGIRLTLSFKELKKQIIPIPPQSEQNAVVKFIKDKEAKFDALTSKLQQEIESIKEYKQRLISDVVTGQIKVC
jgi:type I restriction enzyme S subunit